MTADGTALAATLGCALLDGGRLCWVPLGAFVVSGSVVHAMHGNAGRALWTAPLRLGLPVVGLMAGLVLGDDACPEDHAFESPCGSGGAAIGFLAGALLATALDGLVAFHDAPPPPLRSASPGPGFVAHPAFSMTPGGGAVSLVGRF